MKNIIICLVLALIALGAKTETVTFKVNMHCRNCVTKIQENIAFEKGVKDLKISLENKTVTITYNPSKTTPEVLEAAIRKLGYSVERLDAPEPEKQLLLLSQ